MSTTTTTSTRTDDVWNVEDETLPAGWKSKSDEFAGLIFLSPDGVQFTSRLSGYQHIIQGAFPPEDISEMAAFLVYESWRTSPEIPEGWMFQAGEAGVRFLTTDGSVLDSAEEVVSYLDQSDQSTESFGVKNESWDDAVVEKIEDRNDQEENPSENDPKNEDEEYQGSPAGKDGSDWNDDSTVPRGWKTKWNVVTGGVTLKNPQGKKFLTRQRALHYLITQNGAEEEIDVIRGSMSQEGWTRSDLLPQDWFYRKNNHGEHYFVTDTAQKIRGRTETVKFMKSILTYSEKDIANIDEFLQQEIQKPKPKKKVSIKKFLTLKEKIAKRKLDKKKSEKLLNKEEKSSRKRFGKPESLKTKSKKHQKMGKVEKMKEKFDKIKKEKKKKSVESMINIDDSWLSDDCLPAGWRYKDFSEKSSLPTKFILSPQGDKLPGFSSALRLMMKEKYSPDDVSMMRTFMRKFGWKRDPSLPEEWSVKQGNKSYNFCSPGGEILKSKHQLEKYLKQGRGI